MSTPSGGKSGNPRSVAVSLSPRAEDPFPGHDWSSRNPRQLAIRDSNARSVRPAFRRDVIYRKRWLKPLTCRAFVQAVDKAQSEMTKVLRVRTEQKVRLRLTDFLSYFTLNRLFVNECEAVSGHSGTALKDVANNQILGFIPFLHEVEKQKLVQKMEFEKWERIDFKPQDELMLAHIAYAAKQNKKGPTLAVIEEGKFMLVDSAVFALRGIEQYTILLASIPAMANEISTVLLDYRKLHNSCTPLLIFGAGARITAGLTNINAKHLALTSQSLSFIALIPYVRKCVRRRPSITASGMAEYDRLKRLFQDHRSSIHEKLIDIMSFRVTLYIREMEKIKWDDEMKNRCRGTSVHAWRRSRKSRTRYNEF
ncbi:conserved hypothetical protein [Histoplasma capsulatum H143]|uniref:Vacuolar protein sorting-associated protein 54 C-terminal domain-containing protein n=1 Tax=Ajellomyces capsulatus (strain H143) TaxID=544712 RepID=C6H1Q0_AJECH|nr:conserved hypothetical protein [Histoplasma capsulatum H143]